MIKLFKLIKEHPIWVGAAASVIATGVVSFIKKFYPTIWTAIKNTAVWCISSTLLPHWLIILLFLVFAALVIIGGVTLCLFGNSEATVTENDYTEDRFWGIVWRWSYDDGIYKIASFCPNCDIQIDPEGGHTTPPYGEREAYRFNCDRCRQFNKIVPVSDDSCIEDLARREIQRKLRNGEWRDVLLKQQNKPDRRN